MPNTTAYSFGDVVLVPFPLTDHTDSKKRPALSSVLSGAPDMGVGEDALRRRVYAIAELVSAVADERPFVLAIDDMHWLVLIGDWQGAGLPKASLIKPVIATIEQRLILKKLGALQGNDVQALRSALRQILG